MSDEPLSRRALLSGLAAAGGAGALLGPGTGALFTDTEGVGARMQAGALDVTACWEAPGENCTPSSDGVSVDLGDVSEPGDGGSGTVRVSVPDTPDANPAWLWLRTDCPEPCDLGDALEVTVWDDDGCDGTVESERVYTSGTLCEVGATLHGGVRVDGDPSTGEATPLAPGSERCVGVSWELTRPVCPDDVTVDVEVYAVQARHTEPTTPWPDASCDCEADCDCRPGPGISFVSLCGATDGDVSLATHNVKEEPTAAHWEGTDVQMVTIYYGTSEGQVFENFSVSGDSGTVAVGEGDERLYRSATEQEPSRPCPDASTWLKCEWTEDSQTFVPEGE